MNSYVFSKGISLSYSNTASAAMDHKNISATYEYLRKDFLLIY